MAILTSYPAANSTSCSNCGASLPRAASFCSRCGDSVEGETNSSYFAPTAKRPRIAASREKLMLFVGNNVQYYERKWAAIESSGRSMQMNWAAFFLGPTWFTYRKMYLATLIWFFATVGSGVVQLSIDNSAILIGIDIAFPVVIGLCSNQWYRNFADRKTKKILENTAPARIDMELMRRGGTSILSSALFAILVISVFSLLIIVGLAEQQGH